MAWAFDGEEPEIWWPRHVELFLAGEPLECVWCPTVCNGYLCGACGGSQHVLPRRVEDHIKSGGEIRAHNAEFERHMWREIMHKRYGFPNPRLEQWVCSAAEAAAMSLPRHLELACKVTRIPVQKDNEGYNLMMRMCRPRSKKGAPLEWWYDADRLVRLGEYCKQDVRAEQSLTKVMRRLPPLEREHYLEVCRQNDAGIAVDVALVKAMRAVADEGLARADAALEELTSGAVEGVMNHQQLTAWVNSQGVETDSVAKKAIRDLLERELPTDVRQALEIRQASGRTSLAKLDSTLQCICTDGKIRGMLVYHGASTGRETAKLVQPHNYPRGEVDDVEKYIDLMMLRDFDALDLFHPPIVIVSSMLRSTLTAGPGNELMAADFSGIEARVVNWLADQQDVLDHFRALDAGDKSRDPYIINAMRYYKLPFEAIKKIPHRQTGKFQELGMGFGMGAKTGQVQAKDIYGLILTLEETQAMVDNYRLTHAKVKAYWRAIDNAAIKAVREPGTNVKVGPLQNITFTKRGAYLYMVLPTKRALVYAQPKIIERMAPWKEMVEAVQIMAVNPKSKQWWEQDMYGGIWTENAVQAIARDLMAEAKLRARAAGYPTILTVHDELVSEIPAGFGDVKEFEKILTTSPAWAAGLPVAAEGWRGMRYRK